MQPARGHAAKGWPPRASARPATNGRCCQDRVGDSHRQNSRDPHRYGPDETSASVNFLWLPPPRRVYASLSRSCDHRCASVCIGGSITLRGFIDGWSCKVMEPPMHTDGPRRMEVGPQFPGTGTPGDTSNIRPVAQIWTNTAQPLALVVDHILYYTEQPIDFAPLPAAWQVTLQRQCRYEWQSSTLIRRPRITASDWTRAMPIPSWRAESRHPRLFCAHGKVVDADLRRHDGVEWTLSAISRVVQYRASP